MDECELICPTSTLFQRRLRGFVGLIDKCHTSTGAVNLEQKQKKSLKVVCEQDEQVKALKGLKIMKAHEKKEKQLVDSFQIPTSSVLNLLSICS